MHVCSWKIFSGMNKYNMHTVSSETAKTQFECLKSGKNEGFIHACLIFYLIFLPFFKQNVTTPSPL